MQNGNKLRWVSFIVSCFGIMISGSMNAVPAYINAIKGKFNYEQWEVELIISISNFGFLFLIPAGILSEKIGTRWTTIFGVVMLVSGYLMLWSTTFEIDYYSDRAVLMMLLFFITGFGCGFLFTTIIITNMNNFAPQHLGKMSGILNVSSNIGTIFISTVYFKVFANGANEDYKMHDLGGFYLSAAVATVLVGVLCILFVRTIPNIPDPLQMIDNDIIIERTSSSGFGKDVSNCQLYTTLDFQFFSWAYVIAGSVQLLFQNNIGPFLKSCGKEEYTLLFVNVFSISQMLSKTISGFLSDLLIAYVPRITTVTALTCAQTIALSFCILFPDDFKTLLFAIVILGIAGGNLNCIGIISVREFYGTKYFGRNFGLIYTLLSIAAIGEQALFGEMYQSAIPYEEYNDCYGRQCVLWTYVLHFFLSFISSMLFGVVYLNHS